MMSIPRWTMDSPLYIRFFANNTFEVSYSNETVRQAFVSCIRDTFKGCEHVSDGTFRLKFNVDHLKEEFAESRKEPTGTLTIYRTGDPSHPLNNLKQCLYRGRRKGLIGFTGIELDNSMEIQVYGPELAESNEEIEKKMKQLFGES